jgi:PucR C-terminal helix-turn-helix domain
MLPLSVMAGQSRPKDGVASARLCPGHPRSWQTKGKFVDARDKPGQAEVFYSPRATLTGIAADPNGEGSDPTRTIGQFAACNFNVKRTARHLDLHTNTVYFRLNRIRELTGIDPRCQAGLSLPLTTVRMMGARNGARTVGQ